MKTYFNSWWLSPIIYLIVAAPLFAGVKIYEPYFLIVVLALLAMLVVAAINIFKRRWRIGISNLLSFTICGTLSLAAIMLHSVFEPGEDSFSNNLSIPTDIEITIPKDVSNQKSDQSDAFQMAVLGALNSGNHDSHSVNTEIASLQKAHANSNSNFKRYLATSKSWRVFEERGDIFATRRWIIGSNWRYSLHGYYTNRDADTSQQFQTRLTIGLSGKSWFRSNDNTTILQAGQIKNITLKQPVTQSNQYESHLIVEADSGLNVEIFEQSKTKERRITIASLEYLEKEFEQAAKGNFSKDNARQGQASLELTKSFQPGIYDAYIWVNPGEAGMIYLKAFEVTKGTLLSAGRLKASSNEWIGWSDKPDEQFFSNTHIMIYEGDWGKPYAARFEVWFKPDSGKVERKLLDRVFKIQGWQR